MTTRNRAASIYLLTTSLLLTTTNSAGIRGLGQGISPGSGDTFVKTLFYDPPTKGRPPPDVLAMLGSGSHYGFSNVFGTRNFVRQGHHAPRPTPYATTDDFPAGRTPVVDPALFQSSDFQEPDYTADLTWEPTKGVSAEGNEENQTFYTSTPSESQTQTESDQDVMVASAVDYPGNDFQKTESSEYDDSAVFPDSNSIDVSSTIWGTEVSTDTEVPLISTTDAIHRKNADSFSVFLGTTVLSTDLPEATSIGKGDQDILGNTEPQEEDLQTTEKPVELMTRVEAEDEETTLSSVFLASQSEQKETYDKGKTKKPSQIVEELSENQQEKTAKEESLVYEGIYHDFEILKETKEGEQTLNENNINKIDESRDKRKSIYFTIDDGPTKDGEIRVKLGKALDYDTNQNALNKKEEEIYQYHFQDPDTGWYKFGYGDNHQWRHEERRGDGIVLGRYGWHDANGKEHTTHFVADAKGYRTVQPGQKITMHVAPPSATSTYLPTAPHPGILAPSALTTVRPFFTRKPTAPPSSSTTASFPITSLSTTFTLSTHPSKPGHPSPTGTVASYPGSIEELIRPGTDVSVVTGRPPIAYPLPHPSVSHRPGSWVFVAPTPLPSGANRPFDRPSFKPFRPYPTNRPLKSPFRPVNRPRPKPNRRRPLKPLQSNLNKNSKPQDEKTSDSEASDDKPVKDNNDKPDSKPSLDNDLIGQLQAFLNNPSKYPIAQSSQLKPDKPSVPDESQPEPETGLNLNPDESDSTSSLSPNELLHFINLINSLKVQGQEEATSVGSPAWSVSPWSSNGVKIPQAQTFNNPVKPPTNLRPPPTPFSPPSHQDFSGSSFHEVFHDGTHSHFPLDYAFMDEDYGMLGIVPGIHSIHNKPEGNNAQSQFNINGFPSTATILNIPGASGPTEASSSTSNIDKDKKPANEVVGSVTWKIPGYVKPQNTVTTEAMGGNSSSGTTTETSDDSSKSTTLEPMSSTKSPEPITKFLTTELPLTTSEEPITDSIWPYKSTVSSTATLDKTTTLRPPPPPPQNFWGDILERIYYWPNSGPQNRPTIQ